MINYFTFASTVSRMISAALSCFDIALLPVQYVRGVRRITRLFRGSLQGHVTSAVLIILSSVSAALSHRLFTVVSPVLRGSFEEQLLGGAKLHGFAKPPGGTALLQERCMHA